VEHDFEADLAAVAAIAAVPTILDVICRTTGIGFAAVARVTEDRWIACSVRDNIAFGLKPGGELEVETTLCNEVRANADPIVIDHVAADTVYRSHKTPALYGFQSYISMPIVLPDGTFFGTLCAIDPRPLRLNTPETVDMFKLFADLIAMHLDTHNRLAVSNANLLSERETAELREQFIAVLGHDLRNPLAAIKGGLRMVLRAPLDERTRFAADLMQSSADRMVALIDNMLDFARGRLGGGLPLEQSDVVIRPVLQQIVDELHDPSADHAVTSQIVLSPDDLLYCDPVRIGQLFSNLLANALTYKTAGTPVRVRASFEDGTFLLSVANAGAPIPDVMRAKLFEPFFRAKVRQSKQGLGLGLYIASQIARAHGGTIEVQSGDAETRFTFRMPQR
jgi:signal transduction histidine kinase